VAVCLDRPVRTPDTILRDTDWAALSTAYGPGTDVPPHLRALLSEDPEACTAAAGFLEGNLLHQLAISNRALAHALVALTKSMG